MFVAFHQLPLAGMFAAVLAICLAMGWLVIGLVRILVPLAGLWLDEPLPIRDSLVGACGALFALILAFSAAGIWNDAVAARNAVQREADAIENALVLSASLPEQTQAVLAEDLRAYLKEVVATDWPAMAQSRPVEDPIFDRSEKHLLLAIRLVSRHLSAAAAPAAYIPLLNQILDVRHARLARLSASNAGISWAQWVAMWLISAATLLVIAVCNSHSFRMQVLATHIYVAVISAAYFVILAHDRPFVGVVSIQPAAIQTLLPRETDRP